MASPLKNVNFSGGHESGATPSGRSRCMRFGNRKRGGAWAAFRPLPDDDCSGQSRCRGGPDELAAGGGLGGEAILEQFHFRTASRRPMQPLPPGKRGRSRSVVQREHRERVKRFHTELDVGLGVDEWDRRLLRESQDATNPLAG